ncbi:hypothetical protein F5972_08520 [Microbispora cellulosiformans]|uniref:Uncharacterized protein n=1 Tax=Microbispora cellulosiformans TaxID=2614688 RepID=A0A5J5K585_9ACTN|nr:hypothetical protein [Microbispora cellulosiformans]KAA9379686.1 hypothetical protein F5972_08520 [Microbispora cellulosiformans]
MITRPAAAPVVVTLPAEQWTQVIDALLWSASRLDGPGWCFCPDLDPETGLCDDCAAGEARAYDLRDLVDRLRPQVAGRGRYRPAALLAAEWASVAEGVADGAARLLDRTGGDCADQPHPCWECANERRETAGMRKAAARIARRVRRTHHTAAHPLAAAVLAGCLARLNEEVDWTGRGLGDMTRTVPAPADEWEFFDRLRARRDQVAARLNRRPRAPRGTRARTR